MSTSHCGKPIDPIVDISRQAPAATTAPDHVPVQAPAATADPVPAPVLDPAPTATGYLFGSGDTGTFKIPRN